VLVIEASAALHSVLASLMAPFKSDFVAANSIFASAALSLDLTVFNSPVFSSVKSAQASTVDFIAFNVKPTSDSLLSNSAPAHCLIVASFPFMTVSANDLISLSL